MGSRTFGEISTFGDFILFYCLRGARTLLYILVMASGSVFRWKDWNLEHATQHGCTIVEIESVVRNAGHGFPRYAGDGKWLVYGRGNGRRMIEVIYIVDPDDAIFVIHAMPVTLRRWRGK
jgi:hypothetical protein